MCTHTHIYGGGESPKRGNHQLGYAQDATRSNYSPGQAQPSQDTQVRETKKDRLLEEPEKQLPLRRLEINQQSHKDKGRRR